MAPSLIVITAATLAQLDKVDPSFLRDWLIVVAVMIGLAVGIFTLAEKIKGKKATETVISPNPLKTQAVQELATKDEMDQLGERLEKDIEEIREQLERERAAARDALGKVHARIDALVTNTGEIKGGLQEIGKTLGTIVKKMINNH